MIIQKNNLFVSLRDIRVKFNRLAKATKMWSINSAFFVILKQKSIEIYQDQYLFIQSKLIEGKL